MLATKGKPRNVTGIEIIECSEIIESDNPGCLTDVDFSKCFAEEFVEGDRRSIRSLNTNRKTHRETFAKKCEVMLDVINIENELNGVNVNYNRAKIEQTDKDITYVLRKSRK